MTQSAGLKTIVDNGRERRTDGLLKHLGLIDAGALRVTDNQNANAGPGGVEILFDRPSRAGYIQAFQREPSLAYLDLNIYGRNISLYPQSGKVSLPQGTAQSLVAQWFQPSGWSVPTASTWLETDVRATGTWTGPGTLLRIEYSVTITISTVGQSCYVGIGTDGGLNWPSVGFAHCALAGQYITVSGVVYHTNPPAGTHRVGVWVYASLVGTALVSAIYATLWVTEQRA